MKRVLFIASECVPFIKTGGLADVVGSLPKCFDKKYFDVRVSYFLMYALSVVALVLLVGYSICCKKFSLLIISAYLAYWLLRGNL